MSDENQQTPKVFISYSWTSDGHTEWVADLAERLMNDGIEVVLDQWSLEDGHDVNAFMEKMVTDPTIKRVIIISDAMYAAKADGRRGGVGTETQIISKKVYDSVNQNKFIPVLREWDEEGKPCLPVYLESRKFIDMSDSDKEPDGYDHLIRNIYERPKRRKPALGKKPSHLFEDSPVAVTSAHKAKRFRDLVESGKGVPLVAFDDFSAEFIANLAELRMAYVENEKDQWCEKLKANIANAQSHRDVLVDVIRTGAAHLPGSEFVPALLTLLERILPFTERPNATHMSYRASEDNYKFLCYEFFLYTTAAFIKAKKYHEARELIEHRYVVPRTYGGTDLEARDFSRFNDDTESLDGMCAQQGNTRRWSVMADLLRDRADRTDVRFSDLLQADMVLYLASTRTYGWHPRSAIYAGSVGKLELFLRAATIRGFQPLGTLFGIKTPQELLTLLSGESIKNLFGRERFWCAGITLEFLNFEELQHVWGRT